MTNRILRQGDVLEAVGIGKTTLWRWINAGTFPKPRKLGGGRAIGWLASDIDAWMESQPVSA